MSKVEKDDEEASRMPILSSLCGTRYMIPSGPRTPPAYLELEEMVLEMSIARSVLVPRHRRQTPRLIRRRVGVGRRVPHHRRVEKRAKSEARRPLRAPCFPQTTCPCAQVTSPPALPLQPPSQGAKPAPPNRQHVLTPFTTSIHSPCTHAHPPASGQTSTKPPVHASAAM